MKKYFLLILGFYVILLSISGIKSKAQCVGNPTYTTLDCTGLSCEQLEKVSSYAKNYNVSPTNKNCKCSANYNFTNNYNNWNQVYQSLPNWGISSSMSS